MNYENELIKTAVSIIEDSFAVVLQWHYELHRSQISAMSGIGINLEKILGHCVTI